MKRRAVLAAGLGLILALGEITGAAWGGKAPKSAWEADSGKEVREIGLNAQSAVLMDGRTGRVLYGKNEEVVRPMASTTKIMTCILALEEGRLDDTVTASKNAASQPQVHLGVKEGEEFYLKDLLYSLMLESHNDTAVMLAEHIGGSVEGFAGMMNQKAGELGCTDTWFITPNGLDASGTDGEGRERIHSTTAKDLARIMSYCVSGSPMREAFLEVTQTRSYSFADKAGERSFQCLNHNAFLDMEKGAISGKTGFTGGAGYSYVGAVEDEGRLFIIALLGCGWPPHKSLKWTDARRLIQYGKENYELKNVYRPQKFSPVPVEGGLCWDEGRGRNDQVELEAKGEELLLLLREGEQVQARQNLPKSLKAPVEAGQQVGTVEYLLEGRVMGSFPIRAAGSVRAMTGMDCALRAAEVFFGAGERGGE